LRLFQRQFDATLRDNSKTGFFEASIYLTGKISTSRVRFDYGQCPFDGHGLEPLSLLMGYNERVLNNPIYLRPLAGKRAPYTGIGLSAQPILSNKSSEKARFDTPILHDMTLAHAAY